MAPRLKAFTEIYCGLASDSYHLWGIWGSLPADKIRLVDREDNGLSVWISNQFINWEHYEETDEFIPCWQDVKRSKGVQEFFRANRFKSGNDERPLED